ncbi:MAG: cytochrome-c peroxidase [Pseudobacteriovorax sp.]|nr:cytochrome-c peroxidase [Pseudobacteriovorax sp.]
MLITLLSMGPSLTGFSQARKGEPIAPIEAPTGYHKAKVELGKKLFFDPRLSKSSAISCNSCHNLMTGGSDNQVSSIGHNWQLGPINSPTVLNAKYNIAQFWDGRAKDLKEQAGGPIANPKEMGFTHELALEVVESIPGYKSSFSKVYGTKAVTIDQVTDAIAAFEETLVTPNSPFDQWLLGDDKALTALELAGYQNFKAKGCVACHNGPAVGGGSFHKMGIVKPYPTKAEGRFAVTKNPADKQVFKVPTLRNIELTYPYFHDGSVWSLEQAVDIMAEHQLGIKLSKEENNSIVAFLKTLTGDQPSFALPQLPPSTISTPTYRKEASLTPTKSKASH